MFLLPGLPDPPDLFSSGFHQQYFTEMAFSTWVMVSFLPHLIRVSFPFPSTPCRFSHRWSLCSLKHVEHLIQVGKRPWLAVYLTGHSSSVSFSGLLSLPRPLRGRDPPELSPWTLLLFLDMTPMMILLKSMPLSTIRAWLRVSLSLSGTTYWGFYGCIR